MAKIADVFGRVEAFSICVVLTLLGYIQMATSSNVETFASAQVFYSAGTMGMQILQQIFVADTTDMLNRALFSNLPDVPFLVTTWIGAPIGASIMAQTGSWRWAYGMWAIILPVTFLPFAITLFLNMRKAKRMGIASKNSTLRGNPLQMIKNVWIDLDLGGILLLSASFALILLPLTLASQSGAGWNNPTMIALIVVGFVLLLVFPLWEAKRKVTIGGRTIPVAPYPLIPLNLLRSRTFSAGCGIGFFYFSESGHLNALNY
jgi:MFS family permease